ncbi:ASST-domain-containing protein [Aspergillus bertholletiae]|uniref:ASST-domain-containing protein n=1 Tax=Aspergillus bertholletiae TaxID=1226010 RepID=A0A5N7AX84_9EURO|nr:ASST-domain-containing protein [Aspergillus bertholletiae]
MAEPAWPCVLLAIITLSTFSTGQDMPFGYSDDLSNFITHPEFKVPLLNVSTQDKQGLAPGYWFMTPYHGLQSPLIASPFYYQPCQVGPAIYDSVGVLESLAGLSGDSEASTLILSLTGFNFSKQHDARFVRSNKTHTIISFLNNAAGNGDQSASYSSGLIVSLDTAASPMTASILAKYDRPDKGLTRQRGNVQILNNGHILGNWSGGGYFTEFDTHGEVLMEAKFASERFSSYRVYKHTFTGSPTYPPRLRAFSYGTEESKATTVFYVSWNGATEVRLWRFYSKEKETEIPLGEMRRTGFETQFMAEGFYKKVVVEAFDANGTSLGRSEVEQVVRPQNWETAAFAQNFAQASMTVLWLAPAAIVVVFMVGVGFGSRLLRRHPKGYKKTNLT